jgi:DNA-binding NarL/FixJ family response regulator
MGAQRIRVLCVDDHPMILEGLAAIIGKQADIELSATATSGEQALEVFRRCQPDVTLMDLQLPGLSGLDTITTIRRESPQARIIVLTMFQGEEDIYRALKAGAATYLLKGVPSDELLQTVRRVHAGERPLPASVALLLAARDGNMLLTVREVEVLELVANGFRNKEIAGALRISIETAKTHVKSILGKLKVNDRTAAVQVALQRGLIHLREPDGH